MSLYTKIPPLRGTNPLRSHKGLFITFEGVLEGIGKSTQAQLLAMSLREAGYEVTLTHEPGGTVFGQHVRALLLDPSMHLSKASELFLFLADRAQNYKEVIKPSLKAGHIVISDRYFDSTLAYQGAGRGWKTALLWRLHHATTGSLLPDLTIVLDGIPHIDRQSERPDRIEAENQTFFKQVRGAMLDLATKDKRYALVNANVDETTLCQHIVSIIHERELLGPVKAPGE
jgi:dTMP kinase